VSEHDVSAELPEECRGRWESFVDEKLRETNRRNTVELVRRCPGALDSFCMLSSSLCLSPSPRMPAS